jgi:hypothetical protein
MERALRLLLVLILALPAAPSFAGKETPKLEIVSSRGPKREVKLYSGEVLVFRVREARHGIDAVFGSNAWLDGVTFTLRSHPAVKQDAIAIAKGRNAGVVRDQKPSEALWGDPPSVFRMEVGRKSNADAELEPPGRYLLTASKPGYVAATVIVHLAAFEIVDIDADLTERQYVASFSVRLEDPDEPGKPIPLLVESLDADGRVIDLRRDIALSLLKERRGEFRSTRRVRLSSLAIESFEERLRRRDDDPLPPEFFDVRPLRISEGGSIRLSMRNLHAVYPVPLGY